MVDAAATEIPSKPGDRAQGVSVASLSTNRFRVTARATVLAAEAQKKTRLLLGSNRHNMQKARLTSPANNTEGTTVTTSSSDDLRQSAGSDPALSVVMPAYNAALYVERSINSILDQTFVDLELVVVDDASSDTTWDIVQEAAARDQRVVAVRNETNLGVTATVTRGIEIARAPLIGRMDADDISLPTRFEKQLELLAENPHFAVVGTYASHMNEDDEVLSFSRTGPGSEEEFSKLRDRGEATMVFGGTSLFRKATFYEAGGFDLAITTGEDLELFDRMAELGPVVAVPEALLLYRLHETSLVRTTFLEGRRVHRYVKARRQARAAGEDLDLATFLRSEQTRPFYRRMATSLDDRAQFHYREAGTAYGNGDKARFAVQLVIAFFANPLFVVRRLWNQRLSPSARAQARF